MKRPTCPPRSCSTSAIAPGRPASPRGDLADGAATLAAPWASDGFADEWRRNTRRFPRGVDLLLVDSDTVAAVPRTTRLTPADQEQEG